MTKETISQKIKPILLKNGVKKASIFGSYAKKETHKYSDVDLLVELGRDKSLLDLVDLQFQLEESLGKKVDLVTYRSLHPLLKDRILKEQIRLL